MFVIGGFLLLLNPVYRRVTPLAFMNIVTISRPEYWANVLIYFQRPPVLSISLQHFSLAIDRRFYAALANMKKKFIALKSITI